MRRSVAFMVAMCAVAAGCGTDDGPLSPTCTEDAAKVVGALRAAPATVRLADGTSLSGCVGHATSDAELQNLGFTLTEAADALAARAAASDAAALRLGFLVGAARRGARRTGGVSEELVRRLESTVLLDDAPPARRAAYERGVAAGLARG